MRELLILSVIALSGFWSRAAKTTYHLTAVRHRGEVLYHLDSWYVDSVHQRTTLEITLPDGVRITTGTIVNGNESWSYRIQPSQPDLTRGAHFTDGRALQGRTLFDVGVTDTIISRYERRGCKVTRKPSSDVIAGRQVTLVKITPTATCGSFEIPAAAYITNDINYYRSVRSGTASTSSGGEGPMSLWIDRETSTVLRADRTMGDGSPWDRYVVDSITYSPTLPEHVLEFAPPAGMIVVTNPHD